MMMTIRFRPTVQQYRAPDCLFPLTTPRLGSIGDPHPDPDHGTHADHADHGNHADHALHGDHGDHGHNLD